MKKARNTLKKIFTCLCIAVVLFGHPSYAEVTR